MFLFFKNYPVSEDASLLIRFSKVKSFLVNKEDRSRVNKQNTYSETALERAIKDEN